MYKNRFNISEHAEIKNKYVLFVEDLKISFKEKEVLKGITMGLRQGETLAIVGANGSGKTVLMETILGIIPKQEGEIYLNLGHETFKDNLKEVGIQFQQSKFGKRVKVKRVFSEHLSLYKEKTSQEELDEIIKAFEIEEVLDKKINKLSGGQQQRINLALSIMHNPKIMILDEFITGLDVKSVREIITYVNDLKLKNNASMIIISHQPEEVEALADRVIVLHDGVITQEATPKEIIEKYGNMALFIEKNI